jgi:ketosteroid isomerase-like protein
MTRGFSVNSFGRQDATVGHSRRWSRRWPCSQATAQAVRIKRSGNCRPDEIEKDRCEMFGVIEVRIVAYSGKDLESASGHCLVGSMCVRNGDQGIFLAPDDHRRQLGGEIESVIGAYALTSEVDQASHGLEERPASLGFLERDERAPHLTEIRARTEPDPSQGLHQRGDAAVEPNAEPREHHIGAVQRSSPEDRMDLAAQATARDEDEPLGAVWKLVAELQGHAAAERVPDNRSSVFVEGLEQIANQIRVSTKGIVARRLGGIAMAQEIGRDHRVVLDEPRNHFFPGQRARGNSVQQHDRRTAPSHPITVSLTVQLDFEPIGGVSLLRVVLHMDGRQHASQSCPAQSVALDPLSHPKTLRISTIRSGKRLRCGKQRRRLRRLVSRPRTDREPLRGICMRPLSIGSVLVLFGALAQSRSQQTAPPSAVPSVALPAELDRVLRDYERAWRARDPAALAMLFAEDGFVLANGRPPVRSRDAIRAAYAEGGGPLVLRALSYASEGAVAYIIGAYGPGEGRGDTGKFILALRRGSDGRWLIAADMDNSNQRPPR